MEDSYSSFSPELGNLVRRFFDERWIDAPVRPGKRAGAFCAYGSPSVHPYVMLNWTSRRRDVLTLAHELGHGVHAALGGRQGIFHMATPLTLAETASVFGETIVFGRLLERAETPESRLSLLAESIEGSIATVFRQIAMNQFEARIHNERREHGELALDHIGELWAQSQEELLGDAVEVTDNYRSWWSYVHHFVSVPGYVYAYAYGQLLALAVYGRYEEEGEAFVPAYLKLLEAGGSRSPEELGADRRHRPRRPRLLGPRPRARRAPARRRRAGRARRRPAVSTSQLRIEERVRGAAAAREVRRDGISFDSSRCGRERTSRSDRHAFDGPVTAGRIERNAGCAGRRRPPVHPSMRSSEAQHRPRDDPRERGELVDAHALVDRVRELEAARADHHGRDAARAEQPHVGPVGHAGQPRGAALGAHRRRHGAHPGMRRVGLAGGELAAGPLDLDRRRLAVVQHGLEGGAGSPRARRRAGRRGGPRPTTRSGTELDHSPPSMRPTLSG